VKEVLEGEMGSATGTEGGVIRVIMVVSSLSLFYFIWCTNAEMTGNPLNDYNII
jgi:hypothetical protein